MSGAVGLTSMIASACGAGGQSGDTSGSNAPLTLLCEAGGKAELTKIAELFHQETGHAVSFVELPYNGLFNRLSSELSSGTVSFDVAAVDAIWLSTFAGALHPLDELFTADVKSDLFPALVSEAQVDGRFVAMPTWTNAEILFYRKDLFEAPGERTAFESQFGYPLEVPKTWQQFEDTARFFTRGTELYGTDVKGAVETEWLAHVLQAGSPGVVLDPDDNIIIDNEQHLAALRFYSDLNNRHRVAPPGAAQLDWAGAQNLFNQGKTAMLRFWAHAFPLIPSDSPVHGKVGAAPMIAGSAGIAAIPGPWHLSVPAAGRNTELATEFIQFSYENNALGIQSSLGLAARRSAFDKYSDKPGYEHFTPLLDTLSAPATKVRPATPKWQQIVDTVLVPMLQKSLTDNADYAALLKDAREDVQRLVS
ncbi:extracellular solute-binding protein [Frankia sp. EAN1pec]|uniref:extracellular solute-binding protein n=1 Tax=Parafrankia sp. (strain EAN1pec) TaxID=298653 RepID=UPI0006745B3A